MKYIVFHAEERGIRFTYNPEHWRKNRDVFVEVATVEACDLEEVFQKTNSMSPDGALWTQHKDVQAVRERIRSTCVGDVIVNDDNMVFMVSPAGFTNIGGLE